VDQNDPLITDRTIDVAIESYPLEDLPPGFVQRSIGRLSPRPRFHFEFLDLAIPTFLALCTALLGVSMIWITRLDGAAWLSGAISLLEVYVQANLVWLLAIAAIVVLGGVFLLVLVITFWLESPLRLTTGLIPISQDNFTLQGDHLST
jgi:hypothetical protein